MERVCETPNCYRTPQPSRKKCETCRSRIRRERDPLMDTYLNLKSNAKRRGVAFELTLKQWARFCKKNNYLELRGTGADDLTVDRKKIWIGYTYNNIQALPKKENSKKQHQDILDKYNQKPFKYVKPADSAF